MKLNVTPTTRKVVNPITHVHQSAWSRSKTGDGPKYAKNPMRNPRLATQMYEIRVRTAHCEVIVAAPLSCKSSQFDNSLEHDCPGDIKKMALPLGSA